MPQQYDPDAIFIGTGLIVAGALVSALASVLLAGVAVRLVRRALRARALRRLPPRDRDSMPEQVTLSEHEECAWDLFAERGRLEAMERRLLRRGRKAPAP